MTAVYFSKRDYRYDMQNPHSAARAHAIARHVSATAGQLTPLYAALYWRSCRALNEHAFPNPIDPEYSKYYGYYEFIRECESRYHLTQTQINKLWWYATRKVLAVIDEAISLPTSVLW